MTEYQKAAKALQNNNSTVSDYEYLSGLEWNDFLLVDLKNLLLICRETKDPTLTTKGRKNDIIRRLQHFVEVHKAVSGGVTEQQAPVTSSGPSRASFADDPAMMMPSPLRVKRCTAETQNQRSGFAVTKTIKIGPHSHHVQIHASSNTSRIAMPPNLENTELYRDLRTAGFTREQAVDGIQECGGPNANFDDVMLYIISQLEEEQEDILDPDMQATIAESELERDVIESRKRKREYDLLHDCQYDVTDLAEFKGSLLLNGFPSYFNHPTATSGGDENHVFEVFRVLVNLFRAHKKKCARSGKEDDCCSCSPDLMKLRESVMDILLHEEKSYRWYGKNGNAYMFQLAQRINNVYTAAREENDRALRFDSSSSTSGSSHSATEQKEEIDFSYLNLSNALRKEVDRLQSILYAIPETDCDIPGPPREFMNASRSLGVLLHMKDGPSLEEDGLEIIG